MSQVDFNQPPDRQLEDALSQRPKHLGNNAGHDRRCPRVTGSRRPRRAAGSRPAFADTLESTVTFDAARRRLPY